jgi:hypothetical protein
MIEVVVPELTPPGVDTAVVLTIRNALKFVGALLVPRGRWNRVGLGFLIAFAQPTALMVLASGVRTAADRGLRSVGAPSGWMAPDAAVLAPRDSDALGRHRNRAQHSTYENALSNKHFQAGPPGGVSNVEVRCSPPGGFQLSINAGEACWLPQFVIF